MSKNMNNNTINSNTNNSNKTNKYLLPFETIKRSVLIRKISETSEKFGCYPENRKIEEHIKLGIVNIDKPQGPTSHQVSAYVQKILNINKSGHAGTLDPNVTGVLPIALEKSTKIVQTLLLAGKEYVCLMHFHKKVEEYDLYKVLDKFTGKINQLPPVKSAVKRQLREREIYYIEVLEIKDQDVLFKVGCQAGTYIRK
ncbi:MAG: RNA-guided pseudouridylation complex pseudouridine synthase subunit Cbf5 [Candidatus Woesearchaeota archaeon]